MYRARPIASASLTLLIASMPLAAGAHANASQPPAAVPPAGTADCFRYYRFGSVQANIHTDVSGAVSGVPITFTGALANANPYPVVDGALYVKIFRLNGSAKNVNGPDVVDQFFVRQGISLSAGGKMPVAFTWDIPSYTPTGDYEVATFFTASKKFNLLGLSFTDDIVGNTVRFHVAGEQQKYVAFDKAAVTVAGQAYHFAAFPPEESATASVAVAATVKNTTAKGASAPVSWKLYAWDQGSPENLVAQSDTQVFVAAGKSASVSYTVADAKYPVYLLVGSMRWGNTESIVNIRFVRKGIDRLRINFPSVTAFPLRAGQETTLFSCLHNSGSSASVPGGKLVLELTDLTGKLIHSYTYAGDVTGAMMGVAEKFTPAGNYDQFHLTAKLYQGDQLVDQAFLTYDCNAIDAASCLPANVKGQASWWAFMATPGGIGALLGLSVVLIIAIEGMFLMKRRRRSIVPAVPAQDHLQN